MRPWEIARLTDYQLRHVLFRRRDKHGRLIREEKPAAGMSEKEFFFDVWRDRGESDEQIEVRWREYLSENHAADAE